MWPLPAPFPEMHRKGANRGQRDAARKLGINYMVLVLNFLRSSEQHWRRAMPPLGTPLNATQWAFVRTLRQHVDAWNMEEEVTSEAMGRAAAKVENVEAVLASLEDEADGVAEHLQRYKHRKRKNLHTGWGFRGDPGQVVGQMEMKPAHLAKAVEPHRLQFWGVPSFEAEEFMDEENRAVFLDPLIHAAPPDREKHPPPRVRVRVARKDKLALLEKLDEVERLALVPARLVRAGYENGLFTVPKDETRDRMVLDARPPNCLEENEDKWIRSLCSLVQLNHFFLEPEEEARLFAEDLREYYHAFSISKSRTLRNALKLRVKPSTVAHLKCYHAGLGEEQFLVPCLQTMAMGDNRAVSFGQVAHLSVLLRTGCLQLSDFICLAARPPRQKWLAGLMIDDLVLLEAVKKGALAASSKCQAIIREVREKYEEVKLPRHAGKAVHNETKGTFWGAQLDGEEGCLRPNLKRAIPLAFIILRVLELGRVSVGLLEVIAGSLVAIFQLRRRFMSVLQEIYGAQRDRREEDVILLSGDLQDELLCSLALLPLSCIDMRLSPSPYLVCSDASNRAEAAVRTRVGEQATRELQKYGLQKGLWNKLLCPLDAYLKEKGLADETLPLNEEYTMHPAWQAIAESKRFEKFGKVTKVKSRRHINVGEMRAALAAERNVGMEQPNSYYVHLQDSQVSLAALVKGRSSSRSLNQQMKSSIPDHVRFNTRPFYGFVRSAYNPADDPTRDAALRVPSRSEPPWLEDLQKGNYEQFDEEMKRLCSHLSQMTGLPPAEQLKPRIEVDLRSAGTLKRLKRRASLDLASKQALGAERQSPVEETGGGLATGPARAPSFEENDGDPMGAPQQGSHALGAERQSPVEETGGGLATGLVGAPSARAAGDGLAERDKKPPEKRKEDALHGAQSCECGSGEAQTEHPPGEGSAGWDNEELRQLALRELACFDKSQFLWSQEFSGWEEAICSGPGVLDLFSGSRGFAKAMVKTAKTWCLTFDIEHSVSEDLSKKPLQQTLVRLTRLGLFAAMGAGPVCASFSTAITPPVRSLEHPEGVPWCSEVQRAKNELGNTFLAFILRLVSACLFSCTVFFVENPDGSWIWRQTRPELSWKRILGHATVADFRVDFCRFGTRWRKRTRFRTSCHLGGQKLLCTCTKPHVVLRGRCKHMKMNMTKLVEPYPRGLCNLLAAAVARDAGFLGERRKLDVNLCAKQTSQRIGEAGNPGPRRPPGPRPAVRLSEIELLEPATVAIRARVMQRFLDWLETECPGVDFQVWLRVPALAVSLLVAFGSHAFESGCPLYYYRQLLAHVQRENPQLRLFMFSAWETVSKWETLEPIQHRPPMPEPLLRAMAAVAVSWRWTRWAAVLLGCFFSICRIGEFIKARRRDVLLPSDLLEDRLVVYVKIPEPKTRRRGARVQYATIVEPSVVHFVSAVWRDLEATDFLYGSTAGAFRYRWDKILLHIGVTKEHRLTPGSLRGGGAVAAHKKGLAISDLLWKMRLQHVQTLSYYLQETTAVSILPALLPEIRQRICDLRDLMPTLLQVVAQQRTVDAQA
eukprot:s216_g27.t1